MPTIPYKLADGTPVRSVTTIIGDNLGWNKNALKYWAWDLGYNYHEDFRKVSEKACDAGTICHALIDADIKGRTYEIPKDASAEVVDLAYNGFWAYARWKESVNLKVVLTEQSMIATVQMKDEEWNYGMTFDCVGEVNGELAIVDYKTSKSVYPDHKIQISAYGHGWEYNFPDKPLTGGYHLLQVGKEDASFHHHFWQSLDKEWAAFLLLLALDRLKPAIEGKKRRAK